MGKFKKSFLTILACVGAAVFSLGSAGCSVELFEYLNSSMNNSAGDSVNGGQYLLQIETVYAMAEEAGYTGSLEDLIEMFKGDSGKQGEKGDQGEQGVGVENAVVEDGTLWIFLSNGSEINCGKFFDAEEMRGEDGLTPSIGENGNWYLGTEDTGIAARGAQGVGIANIEKVETVGLNDTYLITYSDPEKEATTFTVTNARSIVEAEITDGELILYYNDGTNENVGSVVGAQGVGIEKVEINEEGHLIVTLTNGEIIDCGIVCERNTHTHVWNEWVVFKESTCTVVGWKARDCTECGETEMKLLRSAHDLEQHDAKEATCVSVGWNTYETCSICDYTTYEEIPALGHNGVWKTQISASCETDGLEYLECERCNAVLGQRVIYATGHNVVDGVCLNCGEREYTVTVNYLYGDGTIATEPIVQKVWQDETYSIVSPEIVDYRADTLIVTGVATADVSINVTYTAIEMEKITRIRSIELGSVPYNTPFADLGLPATVTAITATGREVALRVYWNAVDYSATTYGAQTVTGAVSAGYGYIFSCENAVVATLTVEENLIVSINPMNLGRLPLGTEYDGLGLPSTAGVTIEGGAVYYLPVVWNTYDYDSSVAGEHTITGTITIETGFNLKDGLTNQAEISFILSETMYGTADIVFLLDTTGSMWDEIQNVRININRFAEKLESEGVSVRWALLEYRDITCDGVHSTKISYCGASEWYIDVTAYERAIATLTVNGGGDREETLIDALKAATYLETRADAKTFYIVVTDADYKVENSYGVSNMNEIINELVASDIITSVVTKTTYYSVYRSLTDATNGILANIDGNFADELWKLCDLIAEEVVYGEVDRIEIVKTPTKVDYESGDYFNGSGMIVRAYYVSGVSREVTGYSVTPYGALRVTDTEVLVNYRGKTATIGITVTETVIPVTGIEVSQQHVELVEEQTHFLAANVLPLNASNQTVLWATENPNVATVVNGRVEAIGVGETKITATTADGYFVVSITVKVTAKTVAVEGIVTNVGALRLMTGSTYTIVATIYPETATNKEIVWTTSNDSVVTVVDGVLVAVAEGDATITAMTVDGGFVARTYIEVRSDKGSLSGRVYDSSSNLLSGVTVKVYNTTLGVEYTVTTDSNGIYNFEELLYGDYTLEYFKTNYISTTQNITLEEEALQLRDIHLALDTSLLPGRVSGGVNDSSSGAGISGITVYVRSGRDNTTGAVLHTVTSGSGGSYTTQDIAPGYYTLQFVDERGGALRYFSQFLNVAVSGNTTTSSQNVSLVLDDEDLNVDSLRIVLTWGSTPRDLDSHLLINNASGTDHHIYYSNKKPSGAEANLDVDDTSSYGPETITITNLKEDSEYCYYVYNYSQNGLTGLSASGATVKVYSGSSLEEALYEFTVPSGSGYYWKVFSYNAYTGEFTLFNQIVSSAPTL